MIEILSNSIDFLEKSKSDNHPVIIYGAGKNFSKIFTMLESVDMVCDKNIEYIPEFSCNVNKPEDLKQYEELIYIIVTISNKKVFQQICGELSNIVKSGIIVNGCENIAFAFDFWSTDISYHTIEKKEKLSINIVCQDGGWIFKKFADRMAEKLTYEDADVTVSPYIKNNVDINHHIPYAAYPPCKNDTLMITHVDNLKKLEILKRQLAIAGMGICMSRDSMNKLVSFGVPRQKLCYVNPAHDNVIKPHKYLIGITHKCHDSEDLRKRATALIDILQDIDSRYFSFFIMGPGWDSIVTSLKISGFEVDYYPEFIYDVYNLMMQKIDYFLYTGFDEGTMGYLDALAAGVGTIVTPQGYHLDTECEIDYPCRTISEFRNAFIELQNKRKKKTESVKDWTWDCYTKKHLDIWNYMTKRVDLFELYKDQLLYEDGIYSMLIEDNRVKGV